MSGRVADASGKAFADDRAQSLIPVCNAARPRRAPKVSGLGDLCGEAGQASQQGQSQAVGAFEGNGGRSVFGGGQHGIPPSLGNQPTQAQAPQSPEEVPSRLRHLLIDPPMLRGESPTKLGVLKPFHQGRAITVGFVQIEAVGEIVEAASGMGVEQQQPRVLALQCPQQRQQRHVLVHVREVAGMEGVAVFHRPASGGVGAVRSGGLPLGGALRFGLAFGLGFFLCLGLGLRCRLCGVGGRGGRVGLGR